MGEKRTKNFGSFSSWRELQCLIYFYIISTQTYPELALFLQDRFVIVRMLIKLPLSKKLLLPKNQIYYL